MSRSASRQITHVCRSCTPALVHSSRPAPLNTVSRPVSAALNAPLGARWASTATRTAHKAANATNSTTRHETDVAMRPSREIEDPLRLAQLTEETRDRFLSVDGIPTAQLTEAALQACLRAAVAIQPSLKRAEVQSKASASRLARLGSERTSTQLPIDAKVNDAINRISASAYGVMTQPNVEITPENLELYVRIQSTLGRPEPLPAIFALYAKKRKPVMKNGQIQYVSQRPNSPTKAVNEHVADMALNTAIEAKNLDAALGIIEGTYGLPAFRRQKLIKYGTVPAMGLATLPFGIFGVATAYAALWQNTMDFSTATAIGVAGISGYAFTVGSLGVIAKLTYKDQMKRVTWTPGTPLRRRWLREEERAALDKVACAWGFKETWRHGEETGPEWEGLKDYMGYRSMLLDRVEFMEGMS